MPLPVAKLDAATARATGLFVRRIAEHYDLRAAILFGSRARQTHRPDSDADVAVLLRGMHADFIATKLAMADIAYEVLLETGVRIQPLPIWDDEWHRPDHYSNPALLKNIEREGVPL
jgi:predicted nucleotidyltransferase